ncbi:protein transport protein Sec16A-like [Sardina pilchardus]|uniref:protein transport protein Sec16A-like n=1 Tax=Sardina pilchardus TaxID=27697 RepID=UPI002E105ABE
MGRFDSLDLARLPELPNDTLILAKIRGEVVPRQLRNLRTCDYVDLPRDQGLGVAPSRVFKTPPETLPRAVKKDQVLQPIQVPPTLHFSYKTNWEDYLGPFDMGVTYAISIYHFAMKKWQRCLRTAWLMDKEAAGHVWGLLALVYRETRSVTGQDIVKLLMSNPMAFEKDENPLSSGEGHQALVNLIIFGKKEEAEQLAKRDALWDHWVILRGFAKGECDAIIMRLIKHLKPSDPMKTYFQILAGTVPAASCEWGNNSWGDWRPHLAMVLCHLNQNDQKKEIMAAMTASLKSHGRPNSAFLCDIIMHLHCGMFLEVSESSIRENSSGPLLTRAEVERGEVYKYVLDLRTDQPFISKYQNYRTVYSRMLLRAGYIQQALHFCESAGTTLLYSEEVNHGFLEDFVKLCSEFHSSQRDFVAPKWMDVLREMAEKILLEKQHGCVIIRAPMKVRAVKAKVATEQPDTASTSPGHQSGTATTTSSPDQSSDDQSGTATTSSDDQSSDDQSGTATTAAGPQTDSDTATTSSPDQSGTATTTAGLQSGPATTAAGLQSDPDTISRDQETKPQKKRNKGCFGWLSCFRCFCFRRKKTY